jgi:hypothetical protein
MLKKDGHDHGGKNGFLCLETATTVAGTLYTLAQLRDDRRAMLGKLQPLSTQFL